MKTAIDGLLSKHHGEKDNLMWEDEDYDSLVQSTCIDPNSLFHPTTMQHISRYVKHLAKRKNTSSALNTSQNKLLETQQLWQCLTTESETVSVPVTPIPPSPVYPPAVGPPQDATLMVGPPQDIPMTQASVERMVKEILDNQQ